MPSKAKNKRKRAEKALKEAAEYIEKEEEGKSAEAIAKDLEIDGQTVRDRLRLGKAPKPIKEATFKLGVSLIQRLLRHYHEDPGHIMELIRGALNPNGQIDEDGYERCRVAAGDRGKKKRLQYVRRRATLSKRSPC